MAALALPFPGFLVLLLFGLFSLMLSCCIPISDALSMRRPPRVPRFPYSAKQRGGVGGGDGGAEGIYLGAGGIKYDIQYYTQTLDHFVFRNESTFQQRYLIDARHWNGADKRGPIFLYCGNEGDIEWFAANSGFLWDIAPVFGALILFPEHRYYGESMPYGSGKAAYKDANSLASLTSEQALADFATLVIDLKKNLSAEASPVILFGGSYGGMLAAWFRIKYPHIAIGAVAASAPILQFEDIVPTDTFYRIVSSDFKRESTSCFNYIQESWDAIDNIAEQNGGLHDLSTKFHMCRDLQGAWELEDWLSSAYSYLAMVDYPFASDFLMPLPAYPIREVCQAIDGLPDGSHVLSRIFAGASVYYNYTGNVDCFQPDDSGNIDLGTSGWNWQACTEMVMPMSSDPNNSMFQPFSWDLKSYEQFCMENYGVKPRPYWITSEYGGKNIKAVLKNSASNIVFSNGLLDPWSGGGVLEDISSSIVALVVPEGAHHLDLRAATESDPNWLVQQRAMEMRYISKWLAEVYRDKKQSTKVSKVSNSWGFLIVMTVAILALIVIIKVDKYLAFGRVPRLYAPLQSAQ